METFRRPFEGLKTGHLPARWIRVSAWLPVLALSGCSLTGGGHDNAHSATVPARAGASAERLPASERDAAEALVRLETAARSRDADELCHSVYVFVGGVPAQCEDTMRRLFRTEDGYSITIRSIRLAGSDRATAAASTRAIDENGRTVISRDTTFRLARRGGIWRVVFIT
jgi:hypothetical protein